MTTDAGRVEPYTERLTPSVWVWVLAAGFAGSFGIVFSRVGTIAAVLAMVVVLALVVVALVRTAVVVAVRDGELVVGRARVPLRLIGGVEVLDPAQMRRARSVELDARAYLCLRGWVPGGVRVRLDDPDDDTPYWLISTRSPARLAAAVRDTHLGR
jgi:hypothetical protein